MPRAIFNVPDEASGFLEDIQNPLCHSAVRLLIASTDVVNFTRDARF
jgi:hypothetical protein